MWFALLALAGCTTERPFPCCRDDPGAVWYPTIDAEILVTADPRDVTATAVGLSPEPHPDQVARAMVQHAGSRTFWATLEKTRAQRAAVRALAAGAGRSEALEAVPFALTGYRVDLQAQDCRLGPWQLPLDGAAIGTCRLRDGSTWTPGEPAPVDTSGCLVHDCSPDPRTDLETSTRLVLAQGGWPAGVDPAVAKAIHLLARCLEPSAPDYCAQVGPIPPRGASH